jgi:hypothetical protein
MEYIDPSESSYSNDQFHLCKLCFQIGNVLVVGFNTEQRVGHIRQEAGHNAGHFTWVWFGMVCKRKQGWKGASSDSDMQNQICKTGYAKPGFQLEDNFANMGF